MNAKYTEKYIEFIYLLLIVLNIVLNDLIITFGDDGGTILMSTDWYY